MEVPVYDFDPISGCLKAKARESVFEKGPSLPIRNRLQYLGENLLDKTQMTNVESLLCQNHCKAKVLMLMYRGLDEELLGQDLTGIVKLHIDDNCRFESTAIFAPGVCYVAEGVYDSGIFNIKKLSLPKLKPCSSALKLLPSDVQNRNDVDVAGKNEAVVVLSEVYLDLSDVRV